MEQSRPAFPATLLDVARATGVHCSTVSLALNHSSKVAATTGDRIRQAAARLGYRRDPVYFALSARRQLARAAPARPLIVFLTNRATMEDFESSAHMPGFLAGARAQADAMGFTCELLLVGDRRISATQIEEDLARRNAQGVILGAFMPHMRQLHLDWSRFAVVKIDSWFMPPPSARISHDQSHTAGESYRRLAQLGYGRIGLAVGQADEVGSHELYSTGYRLQQFLLSGPRVPPFLLESTDRESTRIGKLGR
jgi:LacI family transcriptional regulator